MRLTLLFCLFGIGLCQFTDDQCEPGRTVIVHLFNWKWSDIAAECTRFLGPAGYCGVQVSPPNEHIIIGGRPWWERYQPVSYKLESRSGGRSDFINMVNTCNSVGVKIYADMIINHMVGAGQSGHGTGGSWFDSNSLNFDGVPYGPNDFNCCWCDMCYTGSCSIESYQDANQIRNCRLSGLVDLKLGADYVRGKIADYFNDLLNLGVVGFRVDAAKHMWPGDMKAMYERLSNKNILIFNEVIDQGGEAVGVGDYGGLGRITEFKYSRDIGTVFRGWTALAHLKNFGEGWGHMSRNIALVFVDNHDNQRGHGAGGDAILNFKSPREYKMANAFMLAYDYGLARVMSSYDFWDTDAGPPSVGDGIADVPINDIGTCDGGWMCEHRWHQIKNMVTFRNAAHGQGVNNWWDNGNNQIAFSRGNKGFIAINNEGYTLDQWLNTGLPSGTYCDVISGEKSGSSCTGKSVNVAGSGYAQINVPNGDDPVLAIHEGSKL